MLRTKVINKELKENLIDASTGRLEEQKFELYPLIEKKQWEKIRKHVVDRDLTPAHLSERHTIFNDITERNMLYHLLAFRQHDLFKLMINSGLVASEHLEPLIVKGSLICSGILNDIICNVARLDDDHQHFVDHLRLCLDNHLVTAASLRVSAGENSYTIMQNGHLVPPLLNEEFKRYCIDAMEASVKQKQNQDEIEGWLEILAPSIGLEKIFKSINESIGLSDYITFKEKLDLAMKYALLSSDSEPEKRRHITDFIFKQIKHETQPKKLDEIRTTVENHTKLITIFQTSRFFGFKTDEGLFVYLQAQIEQAIQQRKKELPNSSLTQTNHNRTVMSSALQPQR